MRSLAVASSPPSPVPRIALVTTASVVGTIVVPYIVISLYAAVVPGATRVTEFALRVAEPIALIVVVVIVAVGARWVARASSRPRAIGVATGVIAATFGVSSAWWVGDVDGWTAAAVALQPLAGLLGGWRASRDVAARAGSGDGRAGSTGSLAGQPAKAAAPRVVTPAVAFEATLLPPSAVRTGERAAVRPPAPNAAPAPETRQD